MKIAVKTLKFLCAAAIAFAPSASVAFASSGSSKLKVHALTMAEMQSEYGAGGGGGGTSPVVDAGGGGNGGSPNGGPISGATCDSWASVGCTLEMYSSSISDLSTSKTASYVLAGDLVNESALVTQNVSKTFGGCRVTLINAVGISVPWGVSIGVEVNCGDKPVSATLAPLKRANVFYDEYTSTYTEYLMYNWRRNGVVSGYAGMRTNSYRKVDKSYFTKLI